MRQNVHSSSHRGLAAITATALLGTCGAMLVLSGPAAAQQEEFAIRGIGATKFDSKPGVLHHLTVACITPGTNTFVDCQPEGTIKVTVDAATKKKLGLASTTLAAGKIIATKATSEGQAGGKGDLKASAAVRKKLAKLESVKVVYTVTVTAPIKTVLKTSGAWSVDTFDGAKRLLLRSPGDNFKLAGGGRG